jgi:hypothetical protein
MSPGREPDAIECLFEKLHRGNSAERRAAIQALAPLGPEAAPAVPDLLRLLGSRDVSLREDAAVGLARVGRPAVAALVEALGREDADMRRAILVILATIGPDAVEAEAAVRDLLADDWLGRWAAETLDRIYDRPGAAARRAQTLVVGIMLAVPLAVGLAVWLVLRLLAWAALPPAATAAGLALAVVGVSMGPVLGYRCWHTRRTVALTLLLGVGGGLAGLLLGGLLGAAVEPLAKILRR